MREAGFLPNVTLNVNIAAAPAIEEDAAGDEEEEIASDNAMEEDSYSEEESDENDDIVSIFKQGYTKCT
jgi:ribosomal protein L12E/L44/L45/RPP1/RPP2